MTVRVLVADDHATVRAGLAALFGEVPQMDVVAEAADAQTAIALTAKLSPDVVLMDLHMPGDGIHAISTIDTDQVGVLVLSMHSDAALVRAALRAGARGYLLKDAGALELIRAVLAVANGQSIFDPGVAGVVLKGAQETYPFPGPTPRERDVLDRLSQGLSTQAIADRLGLSAKTVQNNISQVLLKLGARDRAHAVALARDAGTTG